MTNSIAENIKKQIQEKKITMRPKAYFTLGAIIVGIGLTLATIASIFFVSIATFRLRVYQPIDFLSFGNKGFSPFLATFPWIPILITVATIIMGILLMRRYEFSYKHAFTGIAAGFILTLCLMGVIVDATGLPSRTHTTPVFEKIMGTEFTHDNWAVGTITTLKTEEFILATPTQQEFTVFIESATEILPPVPLRTGEWVRVVGEREAANFAAEIILHQPQPRDVKHLYPAQGSYRQMMQNQQQGERKTSP